MATITTDTFLDDGTARTAGETWAINGGVLTIRTDTRWHVGAPASMTGSIGSATISPSLGGGVLLDGRNVRQVNFTSGSGAVPAIGTIVTQPIAGRYSLLRPSIASVRGTGILTCFPSTTLFSLALGVDSPCAD